MTTTATFDLEALRTGHANHDADALGGLYADDAVITIVDHSSPPSNPRVLAGRAQIDDFLRDVCSRPMDHEVQDAFTSGDRLAFTVACRYDSGEQVLTSEVCELRDGRIARETLVQAWDE